MVAGFQDDLDLDDKIPSRPMLAAERVPSKNITLSSEEEEEDVKDSNVVPTPNEDINAEQEKKRYKAQAEGPVCCQRGLSSFLPLASGHPLGNLDVCSFSCKLGCVFFSWACSVQCLLHHT